MNYRVTNEFPPPFKINANVDEEDYKLILKKKFNVILFKNIMQEMFLLNLIYQKIQVMFILILKKIRI